jgi:ribonuclease T1
MSVVAVVAAAPDRGRGRTDVSAAQLRLAMHSLGRRLGTLIDAARLPKRWLALASLIVTLSGLAGTPVLAREWNDWNDQARRAAESGRIGIVAIADLPREARQTLASIENGGPFAYPKKDGSVFGNFEQRLPQQARGYYREYTVPTPGARDRGARRIIAGAGRVDDVARSGEYYYSDDHYRSFLRIRQ